MSDRPDATPPMASQFTVDLQRAADGDTDARNRLWAEHYETLRECAKAWFERNWGKPDGPAVSLGGTDVVHAAFERLRDRTEAMAEGRAFFFKAFYTECMRIVVDHYRRMQRRRGHGAELVPELVADRQLPVDFDTLFDLMGELERMDARLARVAMLKIFETRCGDGGAVRGLTNEEIAQQLGVALRTVEKDWQFAKAWLMQRIAKGN